MKVVLDFILNCLGESKALTSLTVPQQIIIKARLIRHWSPKRSKRLKTWVSEIVNELNYEAF